MRSGPGEARTILRLHVISVRPAKQPLMVRTFLKVCMELIISMHDIELVLYFFIAGEILCVIWREYNHTYILC